MISALENEFDCSDSRAGSNYYLNKSNSFTSIENQGRLIDKSKEDENRN